MDVAYHQRGNLPCHAAVWRGEKNKGRDVQNPGLPIPRLFFVTYQENNYKCAAKGRTNIDKLRKIVVELAILGFEHLGPCQHDGVTL